MDPMRNADVFAGQLTGVLTEASSGGGTAEMQRALAERVFTLLDQIALAAPACPPNVQPEWMAMVGDNDVSLQQSSGFRIMGTRLNGRYVSVILTPENGPQWSITCPRAAGGSLFSGASAQPYQSDFEAPTEMEISIVDGAQVLSTHRFLSSGETVNQLDTASQLQSRSQKIQETLDRVTQEGADVPPATGISDASPAGTIQTDAGGAGGPGLGQAMAGVGRIAAGMAIAAAAGMAAAAVRREIGTSKEPVPPDGSPVKPSYIDSTVQGPLAPPWKLRVTSGPEAGHFYSLKLQTTLGRSNDNDIQILDPEISRNHLRFDIRDDALVLTDLGSSRGTAVDGKRIDRPMPLRNGQVIEVGRSRFVVEETRTSQPAAQTPAAAQAQVAATAKPPAAEPATWYYAEKGAQKGPVTESELRKRLAAGLPRETLIWNGQLDNWEPAHELGLCPAPDPNPRPSPTATPVAPPAPPAPAAEAAVWFFMDHGVRQGPVAESLLRRRLAHGLSPDTQVWNPKLDNWKPAHSVGLCPGAKPAAPPMAQPAHPPPAREKTCKKCGRVLAPQHRFCAGCGTPV